MGKKVIVGLDFDGVVAYNPFRIARAPISYVKRRLLGVTKTQFFVPRNGFERIFWIIMFESSIFPALGTALLRQRVGEGKIEAHLVTGRFNFMKDRLVAWLERFKLAGLFSSVSVNERNEQPHRFKQRVITQKRFDYYIEDNLDIVRYLQGKTSTRIFWIYNVLDRGITYRDKYPYLKKALEAVMMRQSDQSDQ